MSKFTESIVEQATLKWFDALGYSILNASEIAPEEPNSDRQTYAENTPPEITAVLRIWIPPSVR